MSEYKGQAGSTKPRRGKHRGEPMTLLQELRAGRRARRPRDGEIIVGVRRARRFS